MRVTNTIDVDVRDVSDAATIDTITQIVHEMFGHLPGTWQIRLSASVETGRWDLSVRGGFGHHLARFLAVPDRLTEGVDRSLRAFLRGAVQPSSSAHSHPAATGRSRTTTSRPQLRGLPRTPTNPLQKAS